VIIYVVQLLAQSLV